MVDLVIAGTIGLDDIETPFGKVEAALGGSGVYSAHAAAFFAKAGLISIAGEDSDTVFSTPHEKFLRVKILRRIEYNPVQYMQREDRQTE